MYGRHTGEGWGDPHGVESWGEGISLPEAHYPLEEDDPRLEQIRWMKRLRILSRVMGGFRYQLGT